MSLDLSQERVFEAEHPIRHLFLPGGPEASRLIVVFSGFHLANQWKYNYVKTLTGTPEHRVYILDDFGERGCYYLGENKDFLVERSVVQMLDALLAEIGLTRADVVCTGSSKGATAALYLGVRHDYGAVLAAAPQTKIATYCTIETRVGYVAKLIAGSLDPEDMEWLDDLIPNAFRESSYRPDIEIFTSERDGQAPVHVMPFIRLLKELGYPLRVTMGTYEGHNAVRGQFPHLLQERFGVREGRTRFASLP